MNSNIIGIYEDLGATARARTEAIAAQGLFVSGVMEQGYRLWMTLVSTEVNEAMRVAQEFSSCKTPAEVAEIQTRWLQATSARAITSLQGTIEIANFLISNLQINVAAAVAPPTITGAQKGLRAPKALAAPTAAAPKALAAPVAPTAAALAAPLPVVPVAPPPVVPVAVVVPIVVPAAAVVPPTVVSPPASPAAPIAVAASAAPIPDAAPGVPVPAAPVAAVASSVAPPQPVPAAAAPSPVVTPRASGKSSKR